MSKTEYIDYRGNGFWAYDVGLGIFLKYLIDAARSRASSSDSQWLNEAIQGWRVAAVVPNVGTVVNQAWSHEQIVVFIELAEEACCSLEERAKIEAEEIVAWPILEDDRIFMRGESEADTAPIAELGRAIIMLVCGTLPPAPAGTWWFYGSSEGRSTIPMRP